MQEEQRIYTPHEAAKKLGVSVTMLRYLRNTGRIEGISLGNTTVYTDAQLSKADLSPKKTGPKPRLKKSGIDADNLSC